VIDDFHAAVWIDSVTFLVVSSILYKGKSGSCVTRQLQFYVPAIQNASFLSKYLR